MVLSTFILKILWRSVLLVEESGEPGENYLPVANHWQPLSHNVVSSSPRLSGVQTRHVRELITRWKASMSDRLLNGVLSILSVWRNIVIAFTFDCCHFQMVCCPLCHLWWSCRHFEAISRERMWPQH